MKNIETASTRPFYRRTLFFTTFLIVLAGALCIAAGLKMLFPDVLGERYGAAIMILRSNEQALVLRAAGMYAVMNGFLVLAIAFLHVFYSHRIAGPAFRLGREADRIGQGELRADFQLRRKDNLTDLAEALKRTAHRYRETVNALDRHTALLDDKAGSLRGTGRGKTDAAAAAATLREMSAAVKTAEKLLAEIRT